MNILNLTKTVSTAAQRAKGVFEPTPQDKLEIKRLLTFEEGVTHSQRFISHRACILAIIAEEYDAGGVLVDGSSPIVTELTRQIDGMVVHLT
jgi:hypothetical protein